MVLFAAGKSVTKMIQGDICVKILYVIATGSCSHITSTWNIASGFTQLSVQVGKDHRTMYTYSIHPITMDLGVNSELYGKCRALV